MVIKYASIIFMFFRKINIFLFIKPLKQIILKSIL